MFSPTLLASNLKVTVYVIKLWIQMFQGKILINPYKVLKNWTSPKFTLLDFLKVKMSILGKPRPGPWAQFHQHIYTQLLHL
jgi:hypothetical protein